MKTFWVTVTIILALLFDAWVLMITVGMIHSEWIHVLPTLGFAVSIKLNAIFGLIAFVVGMVKIMVED